jgi:hypothetical protein
LCASQYKEFGEGERPTDAVKELHYFFGKPNQSCDYEHVDETNLAQSPGFFYVMVLGQGVLCIVAYILEVCSFIFQRILIRYAGFRGPLVTWVNLELFMGMQSIPNIFAFFLVHIHIRVLLHFFHVQSLPNFSHSNMGRTLAFT